MYKRHRTWHRRHIYKGTQLYLHNEAGSNTQHIFFTMRLAVTHSIIFFTVNPSPLTFAVGEFLFVFFLLFCLLPFLFTLFCLVFFN